MLDSEVRIMDLEILREYLIFAQYLNITKAAERLHVSSSTLSRHLSLLENEFKAQLVEHSRRPRMTPEGNIVLNEVSKIVTMYDAIQESIDDYRQQQRLNIKMAYILEDRAIIDRMVKATARIKERWPKVEIRRAIIENLSYYEALELGDVDVAVVFQKGNIDESLYSIIPVFEDSILAVVRKDGLLGSKTSLNVHELAQLTFYRPSARQYDDFHSLIKKMFLQHGITVATVYVDTSTYDELFHHDALDRVWYCSKSQLIEHGGSMPKSVFETSNIVDIDDAASCFTRYAVYKKDTNNEIIPQLVKLLIEP
jgi:DNA-binding transcriptional LysR family regulator